MLRFDTSVTGLTTDTTTRLTWTRGYIAEGELTFADAEAAITKLNAEKFGGIDTWRLPEVNELFGLIDHTRHSPAIDTDAFECGKYDCVWTGTPYAPSSSGCAWIVSFYGGVVSDGRRNYNAFVRAVSGPSPVSQ